MNYLEPSQTLLHLLTNNVAITVSNNVGPKTQNNINNLSLEGLTVNSVNFFDMTFMKKIKTPQIFNFLIGFWYYIRMWLYLPGKMIPELNECDQCLFFLIL